MGWDPSVLRKYNTTGHFRLLNQLRSDLKGNPLIRPRDGETVGAANRSRSLIRALNASQAAGARGRRTASSANQSPLVVMPAASLDADPATSFRDRLNAIDMR